MSIIKLSRHSLQPMSANDQKQNDRFQKQYVQDQNATIFSNT